MAQYNPRLLTPPPEEEEVYPYRKVWPSIILEMGLLVALAVAAFAVFQILTPELPPRLASVYSLAAAVAPAVLWGLFSLARERTVPEPRARLLTVFVVSALAARAVGIPLVEDFFQVARWLPRSETVARLIGYTFTVGIVQETIKYCVVRYFVWPDYFRVRTDAVAYAAASAVGYATVINLHFVLNESPAPNMVASRILFNAVLHISAGGFVAYGLAELRFNPNSLLLLPVTLLTSALVTGIAVPVRSGLVNAGFFLGISTTNEFLGLIFPVALLAAALSAVSFLFNTAERRTREAFSADEI